MGVISVYSMNQCPCCGELTISRTKLFLEALWIPVGVISCKKCHAIVFANNSPFIEIIVEIIIFCLMIGSLFYFFSIWPGLVIFFLWLTLRAYFKLNKSLGFIDPHL